jgi:hypothetical protein
MVSGLPTREQLAFLTSDQAAEMAAAYLERVGPGIQPFPLFKEFCRLTVLVTLEVAPLRIRKGHPPEVLLTQRPGSDPWWPGQWHLPGVAILPTDVDERHGRHSYDKPLERLYKGELADALTIGTPRLFDAGLRVGPRGPEQTVFKWAEITLDPDYADKPPIGRFFDAARVADSPPEGGLIITHDESIRRAVAHHAAYSALPPELREALL